MWLVSRDEFAYLTPEGFTSINPFSTPDDLESYSPTEDLFLKYSEDPPAFIVYVVRLPYSAWVMANPLVQCDGSYRERENDGEEDYSSD